MAAITRATYKKDLIILHFDIGVNSIAPSDVTEYMKHVQKSIDLETPGYEIKTIFSANPNSRRIKIKCVYPAHLADLNKEEFSPTELIEQLEKEINL